MKIIAILLLVTSPLAYALTPVSECGSIKDKKIAASLIGNPRTADWIFYLCGGLKIVYDLLLYREFVAVKPPEEH